MIDLGPDGLLRIGCVVVAFIGLMMLVVAMVRLEQRARGRVFALILGAVLVLGSIGTVMWTWWT